MRKFFKKTFIKLFGEMTPKDFLLGAAMMAVNVGLVFLYKEVAKENIDFVNL